MLSQCSMLYARLDLFVSSMCLCIWWWCKNKNIWKFANLSRHILSIRSTLINIQHKPCIYLHLWSNLCGYVCFWYIEFKLRDPLVYLSLVFFIRYLFLFRWLCRLCAFWFYVAILWFGPNDRHSIFISIYSSTDFLNLCSICHLLSSKSISRCLFVRYSALLYSIHSIILTAYNMLLFKLCAACSQCSWCIPLHWTNVSAFISCFSYVFTRL